MHADRIALFMQISFLLAGIVSRITKAFGPLRICLALSLSLLVIVCAFIFAGHGLPAFAYGSDSPYQQATSGQAAFEKREAAYRANNVGVALLEQYKAKEAVDQFKRALEIDPDLRLARINLSIALYYLPDEDAAKREAERALTNEPGAPQAHYILGLVARAQNRFEDGIAEFRRVLQIDAADVGSNVNLGQIFLQQKKYPESIAAFRKALVAEPYNETALYNLGLLLSRTGAKDEGQRLIQKFQLYRQSGAGTTLGTSYLEGGRYAEAVVSTGAEAKVVDRLIPEVTFTDATKTFLPEVRTKAGARLGTSTPTGGRQAEAIVLFDYDDDGDLDLFDAAGSQRLLRNDGGKFTDVTSGSGLSISNSQYCFAAVAGDYDNDGRPDLFVARANPSSFVLYHNDGNGHFSDRTKEAGIAQPISQSAPYAAAAFVDVDHDGDLDILVCGPKNFLFRNNGNGTFTEIAKAAGLSGTQSSSSVSAIVPTDFNNNRDVDLFLLSRGSSP